MLSAPISLTIHTYIHTYVCIYLHKEGPVNKTDELWKWTVTTGCPVSMLWRSTGVLWPAPPTHPIQERRRKRKAPVPEGDIMAMELVGRSGNQKAYVVGDGEEGLLFCKKIFLKNIAFRVHKRCPGKC
jgi:hypothetical protein